LITTVVTFITTRIVAVFVTTIVVVAAVPSLVVLIHGNTITITAGTVASGARQNGDDEDTQLIVEVETTGDEVIASVNSEEASCDNQIVQLAALSKLSPTETEAALGKGKGQIHSAATLFVREIEADEDEFRQLSVVSSETEQVFLVRISEVRLTALGEDGSSGVLVTICQMVLVEIRQIIITVVVQPGDDGDND